MLNGVMALRRGRKGHGTVYGGFLNVPGPRVGRMAGVFQDYCLEKGSRYLGDRMRGGRTRLMMRLPS
jgi:hypothetical protein